MGGGLMQLVAYGAQDIYLTGNPQITFFKVVYRRHTNFAMECVEQTLNGSTAAGANVTATVSRNGDLVGKMYVTSVGSQTTTNGSGIVATAEVEIGGQRIDKQTAEWMQIWNELSTPESKAVGLKAMMGDVGTVGASSTGVGMLQVPLLFWFCRNPGLALPLIALQYHEVKVKLTLGAGGTGSEDAKLWADYIYLDTDERRRFAQVSHEYLIEQVQETSASASATQKLNFNHPVKELVWTSAGDYTSAKLVLNGHDRFAAQEEEYFQLRQPFDHHTAIPSQNLPSAALVSSVGALDIFSGSYTQTTVEAESWANAAVTSGDVIVSQGGDGTADISGITAAVTDVDAETAATLVYSFLKNDLVILPKVGDIVSVKVSGICSITNAVTAAADAVEVVAKVTGIADGALTGGLTNAANYHIQLDVSLCEASLGVEIATSAHFTIHSFSILSNTGCRTSQLTTKINCYSFALKPEEHQPSGTCNFSRIDNAQLTTGDALATTDNIYAVNYNVLRVMSGMGGLAYSN